MNAITPYEARNIQHENFKVTFNILMLTFFFAYMGYRFMMDYTKTQNRWEDRMKILEDHMETIEENATYINNEIVNNAEQLKELKEDLYLIAGMYSVLGLVPGCPDSAGDVYEFITRKRGVTRESIIEKLKEMKA